MADVDVGLSALGGKVRGHVTAVPPLGWVGAAALAAAAVLAWHLWDRDVEDTTSWTDPQQPPLNIEEFRSPLGPLLARARRWPGSCPGAC
jgi:hypothetical protein